MHAFFLLLLFLLTTSTGNAFSIGEKSSSDSLEGAWKGTMGKQNVIVCFEQNNGSYVDLTTYNPIPLLAFDSEHKTWHENQKKKSNGIWHIERVTANSLSGKRSDSKGQQTSPIQLYRLNILAKYPLHYCPAYSFHHSLLNRGKTLPQGTLSTLNGKQYATLSAINGAIRTVQLIDTGPHIQMLNIRLINELKSGIFSHLDCIYQQERSATDPSPPILLHTEIKPVFWNSHWISFLKKTMNGCESTSPYFSATYITWNLTTGEKINIWSWINNNHSENTEVEQDNLHLNYAALRPLNKIILKKIIRAQSLPPLIRGKSQRCIVILRENTGYQLSLGERGIVFSTALSPEEAHCNQHTEISYIELTPFLTQEGKSALKSIYNTASNLNQY